MNDLFKLTVICDKCGTGHLPMPVSKNGPPPLCRKCDAALPVGCRKS